MDLIWEFDEFGLRFQWVELGRWWSCVGEELWELTGVGVAGVGDPECVCRWLTSR